MKTKGLKNRTCGQWMDLCAKYHLQRRENEDLVQVVTAEKKERGGLVKEPAEGVSARAGGLLVLQMWQNMPHTCSLEGIPKQVQ